MGPNVEKILGVFPEPRDIQFLPALALRSVTSKSGMGVYASSDVLYKGAVFGRDSLEVAEDLILVKPKLVQEILLTIAGLQGQIFNETSEEEPGKIIHEYRTTRVDGKVIEDTSMSIFHALASKWGGTEHEMAYYGSVDSTPLFLRTLGQYCRVHGDKILDKIIHQRRGKSLAMREVARKSALWLLRKVEQSSSGLVEYKKVNPHGISNQVWKDSEEFYVHENKKNANHHSPIASIEVQGLTYDALYDAAKLVPDLAERCEQTAIAVGHKTMELLWQEERKYFALGLDYDEKDQMRLIQTTTANPAALLDSRIFNNLQEEQKRKYTSALVEKIMSRDFLTDAGIRSRSLSESHLIDHWDYHGSYVSWPKETFDIAKGLKRQGFPQLARQLENRILNVCLKYRAYPEFVYVDGHGRVLATAPSGHSHGELMLVEGTNQPERIQAWTVSAVISIIDSRFKRKIMLKGKHRSTGQWQDALESKLLTQIPSVKRHLNPLTLSARYPTYRYQLRHKNKQD